MNVVYFLTLIVYSEAKEVQRLMSISGERLRNMVDYIELISVQYHAWFMIVEKDNTNNDGECIIKITIVRAL